MCQLVTIGVPSSAGSTLTEFGGPRDGLGVRPSRNPYVAGIFPATDLRFDVTAGGCSCGLIDAIEEGAGAEDKRRRRYERLGWSRAKIERALQASIAAHGRDQTSAEARRFREGVLALLDRMPSIRMFVHMYSGDFDTEAVASKGVAQLSRAAYEAAHGAIPEDILVEIAG